MIKINIDEEKVNRNWLHRKVIDVKKLFKSERGTHSGRVQVKRGGKTFTQVRRLGKKSSGRAGTGKMDKFPESIKKEILEQRSYGESGAKIKNIIENLIETMSEKDHSKMVETGLINEKGSIAVTSQALTDWAKKQGVESSKTRVTGLSKEKEAHDRTKKELDRSNQKIAQLEVSAKHNLEEIKMVQKSKQESDKMRGELREQVRDLDGKLNKCLRGEK